MLGPAHARVVPAPGRPIATVGPVDPDAPDLLPAVLVAASVAWPLIALGVASVTAVALWGLFRRGSIADRARADYGIEGETDPETPG